MRARPARPRRWSAAAGSSRRSSSSLGPLSTGPAPRRSRSRARLGSESRLAEEFAARAGARGAVVYQGRCLPYGERIALWALREVLCEAAGITLEDPARTARMKLRRFSHSVGLEEPTTAALAASAGIALDDAERDWSLLYEAAAESVSRGRASSARCGAGGRSFPRSRTCTGPRPCCSSTGAYRRASEGALDVPHDGRPEFAEANPGWSCCAGMPLSARRAVARALPRAGRRAATERERAAARTGRDAPPRVIRSSPRRSLATSAPAVTRRNVPYGLRRCRRPDRLTAAGREGRARARGRGWLPLLPSVLESTRRAKRSPSCSPHRGARPVVAPPVSALPGDREYVFAHGLTREVAYRSIPRAAWCRTYAAVGAWIEQLAGDRREEFLYLLATTTRPPPRPGTRSLPGSTAETTTS